MQEAKAFFRAASFQGIRGQERHLCVFSDLHGNNVWVTALTAPSSSGFYTRDLIVLLTTWCNRIIFYGFILFYWWRRNAVASTVMDGWKCRRSSSHDTTFPSCIHHESTWRQDVYREITGSAIWKELYRFVIILLIPVKRVLLLLYLQLLPSVPGVSPTRECLLMWNEPVMPTNKPPCGFRGCWYVTGARSF